MLRGYKTYILATVSIVGAVASYLVGDVTLADAVQIALTGAIGATLRNGMK